MAANNPVEVKRLIAELYRVRAAKMEMDFKIAEHGATIERLKQNMVLQDEHIEKLKEKLTELGCDVSGL